MRVVIVGREFSEYDREIREWEREFFQRTGREVERLNPDSSEGETFCRARDIVEYPTVVVEDEVRGAVVQDFRGAPLPAIDDIITYLIS